MSDNKEATFAAGCFWGVEAAFRQVEGVIDVSVGYTGGSVDDPDYRKVCGGGTGHAEAVRVVFDPARVRYEDLVDRFWKIHDPTQRDRQAFDIGSQYRSAIFYHDESQRTAAEVSRAALDASGVWPRPVVTKIESAAEFWVAEAYHQRYYEKHGIVGCRSG